MATVVASAPTVADPVVDQTVDPECVKDGIFYEVVDGQIRELPPMSARETYLASTLIRILGPFAWTAGLGQVQMEMLHLIDRAKKLQSRPDLSFVSFARWPRGRRVPTTNAWDVVPNLAIEVVSPTNTANEVRGKIIEYFAAGVERVWVIYPEFANLDDYDSPTSVRILTRDQTLDGGTLLPGFQLPLVELFEDEAESGGDAGA